MNLKVYRIYGKYTVDKKHKVWNNFRKDAVARDEKDAVEKVLSTLSGTYGIKRKYIKIEKCEEIPPDQSKDPKVVFMLGCK